MAAVVAKAAAERAAEKEAGASKVAVGKAEARVEANWAREAGLA